MPTRRIALPGHASGCVWGPGRRSRRPRARSANGRSSSSSSSSRPSFMPAGRFRFYVRAHTHLYTHTLFFFFFRRGTLFGWSRDREHCTVYTYFSLLSVRGYANFAGVTTHCAYIIFNSLVASPAARWPTRFLAIPVAV